MAGNNNQSFIQLPANVVDPIQLRRFLDKLVQELDVAFSNRGAGGFAEESALAGYAGIDTLNELIVEFVLFRNKVEAGILVTPAISDITLDTESQIVLANSTLDNITVTLPPAVDCFTDNRSISLGINKVDSSTNSVIIQGSGGALVIGESSQTLNYQSEVINLITDGTNWYLEK